MTPSLTLLTLLAGAVGIGAATSATVREQLALSLTRQEASYLELSFFNPEVAANCRVTGATITPHVQVTAHGERSGKVGLLFATLRPDGSPAGPKYTEPVHVAVDAIDGKPLVTSPVIPAPKRDFMLRVSIQDLRADAEADATRETIWTRCRR
ncbi:MAG: hypothetical protein ACRCYQ_12180 [Nocardioides sp.]